MARGRRFCQFSQVVTGIGQPQAGGHFSQLNIGRSQFSHGLSSRPERGIVRAGISLTLRSLHPVPELVLF